MKRVFFDVMRSCFHLAAEARGAFGTGLECSWLRRRELRSYGVKFGPQLSIGRHLRIHRYGGITLGDRAIFGSHTQLMNQGRISIGNDFLAASHLQIETGTHDPATVAPGVKPVVIGDRVWCGVRVTILAGVTIGNDVVIAAGSVVHRSVPDNSVVAGVPARVVRSLDRSALREIWTAWGDHRLPLPARIGNSP